MGNEANGSSMELKGTLVAIIFAFGCEYQFSGMSGSNPFSLA